MDQPIPENSIGPASPKSSIFTSLKSKFKKFSSTFNALPTKSKQLLSLGTTLALVLALPIIVRSIAMTTYFNNRAASGEATGEPPTPLTPSPGLTPTPTPESNTGSPSPKPSPQISYCDQHCNSYNICSNGLTCYQPPTPTCSPGVICAVPAPVCRNPKCLSSATCVCPTSCPALSPTVTLIPTSQSGRAGTALKYTATVIDNNPAGCKPVNFSISEIAPTGWYSSLSYTSTNTAQIVFTSPRNARAATYPVAVEVTTPTQTITATSSYIVARPTPAPKHPIKPISTYCKFSIAGFCLFRTATP